MITTQEMKVLRDESDWVGEQLQRLERTLYHVSQTPELETARAQEPTA